MAGGSPSHPTCIRDGCGRPLLDAYLCKTCADTLRIELERIVESNLTDSRGVPLPGLAAELTTTLLRNDRVGGEQVGWITYTRDNGIPYALAASEAIDHLRLVLSSWIRELWETNGGDDVLGEFRCEDTLVGMASWLLLRPSWMALHVAAGELYLDITEATDYAWRVIDRAPARAYSGICGAVTEDGECEQPLYSDPDHAWVRCRSCGAQWNVAERRTWLLDLAAHKPLTATEIAGLLNHAGITATGAQIRSFASHGRIRAVGTDRRGRPQYTLADVRQALADRYKKRPNEHTARLLAAQ